jgi:hypothetical protein
VDPAHYLVNFIKILEKSKEKSCVLWRGLEKCGCFPFTCTDLSPAQFLSPFFTHKKNAGDVTPCDIETKIYVLLKTTGYMMHQTSLVV